MSAVRKLHLATAVAVLQAAYPGARWTAPTIELYEQMLADLSPDLLREACARLVCTSKFLPTIAEVRDCAADIALGPRRSALEAWAEVAAAAASGSDEPAFGDATTAACVQMLGWRYLDADSSADRARFCELYTHLQRREREEIVSVSGRIGELATQRALQPRQRATVRKRRMSPQERNEAESARIAAASAAAARAHGMARSEGPPVSGAEVARLFGAERCLTDW